MTHEQLLKLVRERKAHGLKFGQGIWTADKFVESLVQCVGNDLCKRYFCAQASIPSLLKEAASKLTFCGDDLAIEKDTMGRVKLASNDFGRRINDMPRREIYEVGRRMDLDLDAN